MAVKSQLTERKLVSLTGERTSIPRFATRWLALEPDRSRVSQVENSPSIA
ncbi:MAG TPA: hypothetical protein IGS17_19310 [Oscillatoriales cyanobacterium M59_W2019_021]|nr:hypothetical protein [Oscillatoriales cyanobacterium M4454_W2019_049]HIK53047.1 hypothetical protein [Oscillatoriales cyanobacterium M59_W2019_021]